jgi:hypothetical protein
MVRIRAPEQGAAMIGKKNLWLAIGAAFVILAFAAPAGAAASEFHWVNVQFNEEGEIESSSAITEDQSYPVEGTFGYTMYNTAGNYGKFECDVSGEAVLHPNNTGEIANFALDPNSCKGTGTYLSKCQLTGYDFWFGGPVWTREVPMQVSATDVVSTGIIMGLSMEKCEVPWSPPVAHGNLAATLPASVGEELGGHPGPLNDLELSGFAEGGGVPTFFFGDLTVAGAYIN